MDGASQASGTTSSLYHRRQRKERPGGRKRGKRIHKERGGKREIFYLLEERQVIGPDVLVEGRFPNKR